MSDPIESPAQSHPDDHDAARCGCADCAQWRASLAPALAAARLDGARAPREAALVECRKVSAKSDARGAVGGTQQETDRADGARACWSRVQALDPAAVVGSGSSIHAALPSPDTYQWSATGPNGCLLLSPADNIVARIDRDGTGWRPQIPGRGPLKWGADFPSAVRQVREVLGDVVPDGSASCSG